MRLKGAPPTGFPALSYVSTPTGAIVGYFTGPGGGGGGGVDSLTDLGVTASATELNYTDGVTSSIQSQLDGKQAADADLTALAALTAPATKLAGIATGATANSPDATLLARANHTGTQSADTLTDGTTNKAFLATERTKLSGVATGATANSADATLLARANHTGTQTASTISDFSTAADARITAASLQASDSDLTAIAALTPSNDDIVQRKAGAWTNRTLAQLKSDISLSGSNTGDQNIATDTHAATGKPTPVDADELPLADSAASFGLKKLTWANIKATLKSYFDTLYAPLATAATLATSTATSGTGQTVIKTFTIPANSVAVGTTFRVKGYGVQNATPGSIAFQVHLGTAGTASDATVTSASQSTSASTGNCYEALVTVQSTGSGGTVIGNCGFLQQNNGCASATTATTAMNTTVQNFITISIAAAAGTHTVTNMIIEQV